MKEFVPAWNLVLLCNAKKKYQPLYVALDTTFNAFANRVVPDQAALTL